MCSRGQLVLRIAAQLSWARRLWAPASNSCKAIYEQVPKTLRDLVCNLVGGPGRDCRLGQRFRFNGLNCF